MNYIEQQLLSAEGLYPDSEEYRNGIGSWLKKRASFVKKVAKGDFKGVAKDVGNVFSKPKKAAAPTTAAAAAPKASAPTTEAPTNVSTDSLPGTSTSKLPLIIGSAVVGLGIIGFIVFKAFGKKK
jgi:hypothetical protein